MLSIDLNSCMDNIGLKQDKVTYSNEDSVDLPSSPLSADKLVIDFSNCPEDVSKQDSENSVDSLDVDVSSSGIVETKIPDDLVHTSSPIASPDDYNMYAFEDDLERGPESPTGDTENNLYDHLLNESDFEEDLCDKPRNDEQFELYDDLLSREHISEKEKLKNLEEKQKQILLENQILSQQLKKVTEEFNSVKTRNSVLVKNISSLYQTAKLEIDRKNSEIDSLRQELDSLIFRRNPKPAFHIKHHPKSRVSSKITCDNPEIQKSSHQESANVENYQVDSNFRRNKEVPTDDKKLKNILNADYLRLQGYQGKSKTRDIAQDEKNYKKTEKTEGYMPSVQVNTETKECEDVSVKSQCKLKDNNNNACRAFEIEKCKESNQTSLLRNLNKKFIHDSSAKLLDFKQSDKNETENSAKNSSKSEKCISKMGSSLDNRKVHKSNIDYIVKNKSLDRRTNLLSKENIEKPASTFKDENPLCAKKEIVLQTNSFEHLENKIPARSGFADVFKSDSNCEDIVKSVLLDILLKVDKIVPEPKKSAQFFNVNDIITSQTKVSNSKNLSDRLLEENTKTKSINPNMDKDKTQKCESSFPIKVHKTECRRSPRKHKRFHPSSSTDVQQLSSKDEVSSHKMRHGVAVRSSPRKSHSVRSECGTKQISGNLARKEMPNSPKRGLPHTKITSKAIRASPRKRANVCEASLKIKSPRSKRLTPKKIAKACRLSPRKRPNGSSSGGNSRVQRNLFSQHSEASPQKKRARHQSGSKEERRNLPEDLHRSSNCALEREHKNKGTERCSRIKLLEKYKRLKVSRNEEHAHLKRMSSVKSMSAVHSPSLSKQNGKEPKRHETVQESCAKSKSTGIELPQSSQRSLNTEVSGSSKQNRYHSERTKRSHSREDGYKKTNQTEKYKSEQTKHNKSVSNHSHHSKGKEDKKVSYLVKRSSCDTKHNNESEKTHTFKHQGKRTKENSPVNSVHDTDDSTSGNSRGKSVRTENLVADCPIKNKKCPVDLEDGEILSD